MTDRTFSIIRSRYFPHEDVAWDPGTRGIIDLPTDRMRVLDDIAEGRVTLSVSGPDPNDGFGFWFDLAAEDARALADKIHLAADAVEVADTVSEDDG